MSHKDAAMAILLDETTFDVDDGSLKNLLDHVVNMCTWNSTSLFQACTGALKGVDYKKYPLISSGIQLSDKVKEIFIYSIPPINGAVAAGGHLSLHILNDTYGIPKDDAKFLTCALAELVKLGRTFEHFPTPDKTEAWLKEIEDCRSTTYKEVFDYCTAVWLQERSPAGKKSSKKTRAQAREDARNHIFKTKPGPLSLGDAVKIIGGKYLSAIGTVANLSPNYVTVDFDKRIKGNTRAKVVRSNVRRI
jgi:hypothetical protein